MYTKFTYGCVPSFNVSVVEDEIGSKNSYGRNIVLELLKFDRVDFSLGVRLLLEVLCLIFFIFSHFI